MMKKYYFIFTLFAFIFVASLLIIIWPSPLPKRVVTTPAPTAIPTQVSWKTYRNDKYGFEFQYPSVLHQYRNPYESSTLTNDIIITEDTSETVSPGGWAGVFISILPNSTQTKFEDFVKQYIQGNHDQLQISNVGSVSSVVNGLNIITVSGEQFSGNRESTSRIFVWNRRNVILIDPNTEYYQSLANQILSTFKFTSVPTPTIASKLESQLGYIKKAYVKDNKNYIDIDYVQWVDDASAPDHFRIVNSIPLIRTFEVLPTALITVFDFSRGEKNTRQINFNELSSSMNWYGLFDIKVQNNQIVAIDKHYIP